MSQRVFVRNLGGTPIVLDVAESTDGVTDGDKGDITVSGGGTVWTIDTNVIREKLAADRTYFVATAGGGGSDSNDGLTSGTPLLTTQKAYDIIVGLDFNGQDVTIQIADGTYTGRLYLGQPWTGGGTLTVQGHSGSPSSVLISTTSLDCFLIEAPLPGLVLIKDLKMTTTTSGNCIRMRAPGIFQHGAVEFGTCAQNHISSEVAGGVVKGIANYTINGNAVTHWQAVSGAVETVGFTITLSGTPAFAYFAYSSRLGLQNIFSNTFSGAASAGTTRYFIDANSVIFTNGGGAAYLPGGIAGTTTSGGQYL